MNVRRPIRGLAGLLIMLLAAHGAAASANPKTPGDDAIRAGRTLYESDCSVCHRLSGAGGVRFGNAMSADLRSPALEHTYRGSDPLIVRAVLQAKDQDGKRLNQPMPAWQGRLSSRQAEEIVAYLHTLRS